MRSLLTSVGPAVFGLFLVGTGARSATQQPVGVPFTLDATASTYPFVTRLHGAVTTFPESLVIVVDSGIVRSQIPTDLGNDGIARDITVTFGLGYQLEDGWAWELETQPQFVVALLRPGETAPVSYLRYMVASIDTVPLADRWLAAQLTVIQQLPGIKHGRLNSYACAEDNLRGPTAASRERARLMKLQYSTTC